MQPQQPLLLQPEHREQGHAFSYFIFLCLVISFHDTPDKPIRGKGTCI